MVIVGYGNYKNYQIQQVPEALLSELADRYELSHKAQSGSDYETLQITIAVHEELQRRRSGGSVVPREPTPSRLLKNTF